MDSLLEEVSCLKQKDLLTLRDTIDYLLNNAHVDPEVLSFLDIISAGLKKQHIKFWMPFHSMDARLKKTVMTANESILLFCNRVSTSRTEKFAAQQQLVDIVISYIKHSQHIPLSFATVVQQCKNVESIFDKAYPGYREGGMAHILFVPTNKKIRLRRQLER